MLRDIILKHCSEREKLGYEPVSEEHITEILEDCAKNGIKATRDDIAPYTGESQEGVDGEREL